MSVDVENLFGWCADSRWDRVTVGDMLARRSWSESNEVAFIASNHIVQ